jgi:hypothetical protein
MHAGFPYQQAAEALGEEVYQNKNIAPTENSVVGMYRPRPD